MNSIPNDKYRRTLTSLLAQKVVCRWSDPDGAEILRDPGMRDKVNQWVAELGLTLASTSSGDGHYLAYATPHAESLADVRDLFSEVMKNLRFNLDVLEILMRVTHRDRSMIPGEVVSQNAVIAAVEQSPDTRTRLEALSTSRHHATVRDQVEALFKRLKSTGLLVETKTTQHHLFTLTARVELIQDVIIFIQEHEQLPVEEPAAEQEKLL